MCATTDKDRKQQGPLKRVSRALANLLDDGKAGGKKNSITVLDGVRGIAVLLVISFHVNLVSGNKLWDWQTNPLASSVTTAGGTGVTLFFVLSGFLLFMPFAKALLFKGSWPLVWVYYLRRMFRIFPGYYISLFLLILVAYQQYLDANHRLNLLLFLTFFMDSSRLTFRTLDGPFWTLAVEWQYYMILPLICVAIAFAVRWVPVSKRLPAIMLCLLGVIAWGLAVRFWGLYYSGNPGQTFLWLPPVVMNVLMFIFFGITGKYTEDFAVGMLISLLYIYAQHPSMRVAFTQRWRQLSPWLWRSGIIILVFSAMWHFKSGESAAWPFLNGIMPVFNWLSEMVLAIGFGLCIAAILYGPESLKRPFNWKLLRWVGLISYSLYIWHLPLLVLFVTRVLPVFHLTNVYVIYLLYWLWVLLVIFPFSLLFFTLIEKPFMRLGDRLRNAIESKHFEKSKLREQAAQPAPRQIRPESAALQRQ